MGNNARFDQPEMALAAYEAWMALEECEKYCVIISEKSAMKVRVGALMPGEHLSVGGPVVTFVEQERRYQIAMARVWEDHPSVGGRVVTLEEQEAVMHVMALEQYEKCLAVRIEAARIKLIAPWIPTSYMADLAKADLDVANTYYKIAGVYKTQDKYELAVFNFKKCLALQIKHLGAYNVDVVKTYYKIGLVYNAQPNYDLALWHFEKCHAIRKVYIENGRGEEFLTFDPAMVRALDQQFGDLS